MYDYMIWVSHCCLVTQYLERGYEEEGSMEMCMGVSWALFLKQMESGV